MSERAKRDERIANSRVFREELNERMRPNQELHQLRERAKAADANASTRLRRDATEDIAPLAGGMLRVNKGTSTDKIMAELKKDFGSGVLETALRFHQAGRYQYRIAADGAGMHIKSGDPASNAYIMFYASDFVTDNNVGVKNNRIRADNAQIRADDAWNLANSKVGQHQHVFPVTRWSQDVNGYMFNGFYEDIQTSGVVF